MNDRWDVMRVLAIIPAFNEEDSIASTVNEFLLAQTGCDYLVVNDGSTDSTEAICCRNGYSHVTHPTNLGLTSGFQTGVKYALEHNYDAVIQFDADGQHVPSFIPRMISEMDEKEADIVIGSRFCTQKKPLTLRMLGSRMLSMAILLTTGKKVSDPTSGMRLYNRSMIALFAGNLNFGPEPDTISYLIAAGASVSEVQVQMHERIAGTSYLSMGRSVRYMLHMFISILLIQFFRQRRNAL